jgi:hypothetical protein
VTRREAAVIGTRLALSHGVSHALALLRPKLRALDNSLSSGATTLALLARLGRELTKLTASVAPIGRTGAHAMGPVEVSPSELADLEPRGFVTRATATPRIDAASMRTILRSSPVMPSTVTPSDQNPLAASNRAGLGEGSQPGFHKSNAPVRSDIPRRTARSDPDNAIQGGLRPAHQAARIGVTTVAETNSQPLLPKTWSDDPPASVLAIGEQPASKSSEDLSDPVTPQTATAKSLQDSLFRPSDHPGWFERTPAMASSLRSVAPKHFPATPTSQPTLHDNQSASEDLSSSPPPPRPNRDLPLDVGRTTSSVMDQSDPTGSGTEAPQGTIMFDGVQLGRWIIDHLERRASRPTTMATGIDPRMNAIFPGAPIGA